MSPIYILHCGDCGYASESFFPTTKIEDWKCEKCGGVHYTKLPASSHFRLHNGKVGGFTSNSSKASGG